jgi:hypothetical protein
MRKKKPKDFPLTNKDPLQIRREKKGKNRSRRRGEKIIIIASTGGFLSSTL